MSRGRLLKSHLLTRSQQADHNDKDQSQLSSKLSNKLTLGKESSEPPKSTPVDHPDSKANHTETTKMHDEKLIPFPCPIIEQPEEANISKHEP